MQPLQRKIVALDALLERVAAARAAGKTVVQCHGCFDIVHPGHIRYLQFARTLADVLVVSVTGDALIDKGHDRPWIPQELRAENLAALEFVDWVIIDPNPTACELLEQVRPDVYLKGREYALSSDARFLRERQIVERHGGRVVFSSGDVVFSSTRLARSLARDEQIEHDRRRAFCRRHAVTRAALERALDSFADRRVLVVGDLISERYLLCDAAELAADAPILSVQRIGQQHHWGGAAAVALQLHALGARPFLLSAVGTDETSRQLVERLADLGVSGHLLRARPGLVTRTTYLTDDAKLFRATEGVVAPLDTASERRAIAILAEQLDDADLLIWCDHGYGMLTPAITAAAGRPAARRTLVRAAHAPGQRGQFDLLRDADLLLASERRLREALNDLGSGLSVAASTLLDRTRGRALLVWMPKRGIVSFARRAHDAGSTGWHERLLSEFVPTFAPRPVDALGVEESMLAVAGLSLAAGQSLEAAAYFASLVEALAITRVGAEPVGPAELRHWFADRDELRESGEFVPDVAATPNPDQETRRRDPGAPAAPRLVPDASLCDAFQPPPPALSAPPRSARAPA